MLFQWSFALESVGVASKNQNETKSLNSEFTRIIMCNASIKVISKIL